MKLAIVGTGMMANVRTKAFLLSSKNCEICSVASKHLHNARIFAKKFNCKHYTDDYRKLLHYEPDAILIEVPHFVQDKITLWALEAGLHVLVGGPLATNSSIGIRIAQLADRKRLIVETGYEARYKEVWRLAKVYLHNDEIGETVAIRCTALFNADPNSWYYDEEKSGGMIITHMTYAFINPIRWLFGSPHFISAFSNQKRETRIENVKHETCVANFLFKDDITCSMTASYIKPKQLNAWNVNILGTNGSLEILPGDMEAGSLTVYSNSQTVLTKNFLEKDNPFEEQAKVFLSALGGDNRCLNPAWDSLLDIQISEAIVESAKEKKTVEFK